jgi:hypothetical protein
MTSNPEDPNSSADDNVVELSARRKGERHEPLVPLRSPGAPSSEESALVGGWQEQSPARGYFSRDAAEVKRPPVRFVRLAAWAAGGAAVASIVVAMAVGHVLAGSRSELRIASSHARTRAAGSSAPWLKLPTILPAVPRSRTIGNLTHPGRHTRARAHQASSSQVEQVAYRAAAASSAPAAASTSQNQAQASASEQSSSATTASTSAPTAQASSAPHPGPYGPLVCVQNC